MKVLNTEEIEVVSGGVFPVVAVYCAYAFVAGATLGIAAAAAAKAD